MNSYFKTVLIFLVLFSFSCKKEEENKIPTAPSGVNLTIDLTSASNATLKTVKGFKYFDGVVVANASSGYVAVSQYCTHDGTNVVFDGSKFICSKDNSAFSLNGNVVNGPAINSLKSYGVHAMSGSLHVHD